MRSPARCLKVFLLVLMSFPAACGAGECCNLAVTYTETEASFVCHFPADVPGSSKNTSIEIHDNLTNQDILTCIVNTATRSARCKAINATEQEAPLHFAVAATIPNLQPSKYQCKSGGKKCSSPCFEDYIEPPRDLQAVNITESSVTIKWTAGQTGTGSRTQSYRVRYKPSDSLSPTYRYDDVTPPSRTNFTITDLKQGTKYDVTVLVVNVQGEIRLPQNRLNFSTAKRSDVTMGQVQDTCPGAATTVTHDIAAFVFAAAAFILSMDIVRFLY